MTESKQATHFVNTNRERRLPALAVSRGIGMGRLTFLHDEKCKYFRLDLAEHQIESELERFRSALHSSILQLREMSANTASDLGRPASDIFGVHLLILESSLIEKIQSVIKIERVNAEWAIRTVSDHYIEQQETVSDHAFRDKYLDIGDVADRLLMALGSFSSTKAADRGSVIVAREMSPSTIVELAKGQPAALITEQGGWTSHSSILAREFNLPMVSGVRNLEHLDLANHNVIVDGINGEVILDPSDESVAKFAAIAASVDATHGQQIGKTGATTETTIVIRANVEQPSAYEIARDKGAKGIGLYRSESLIRHPGWIPNEDQQFEAYCRIAKAVGEDGVRIRTFDVGIERLGSDPHWLEHNPSLGLRGIRLSLADPTHFRIQIRAILRASFQRKIEIILPMISGVSEIIAAKAMIEEERENLTRSSIEIGEPLLGAMIETPAAVLTAAMIAKQVDLLCLGTNDLVQYLLAVDRDNEAVADWYQTLHPAVIRAIGDVLSAGRVADIPVIICGEMAGSPFYVPVLIGLGARELSMNVNSIPPIRQLLSGISASETTALIKNIAALDTAAEIEHCLREYYLENWGSLFPPDFLDSRYR